ncbi:hypothetical protein BpHYR1_019328 [Brachionus plicatilis]|uniref:Uncharacterized protein n=1 Tax=Brachionus plicatilis TaxID=10195 RepID=A0A3M7QL42_BRAPC|nr:hypothetical protein BpHYR1_019328 [Brachionus plicatilis]
MASYLLWYPWLFGAGAKAAPRYETTSGPISPLVSSFGHLISTSNRFILLGLNRIIMISLSYFSTDSIPSNRLLSRSGLVRAMPKIFHYIFMRFLTRANSRLATRFRQINVFLLGWIGRAPNHRQDQNILELLNSFKTVENPTLNNEAWPSYKIAFSSAKCLLLTLLQ